MRGIAERSSVLESNQAYAAKPVEFAHLSIPQSFHKLRTSMPAWVQPSQQKLLPLNLVYPASFPLQLNESLSYRSNRMKANDDDQLALSLKTSG
jgi:hypothetical protein